LIAGLESAGVIVRHEFIPRIEDYYRAADLYVFPVEHGSGAIEFPLSVLEAMACDLPVVTTPFGALPEYFTEGEGLCFVGDGRSVLQATRLVLEQPVRNRERVRSFSWDGVLDSLETALREAMGR
jgi:glycosyltransferase involved in cell wall biosynthesis